MSACNQALKNITRALYIFAWGVGNVPDDMAGEQRSCSSTQQMLQTLRQLRQTCQILTSCWSSQSGPGQLPLSCRSPTAEHGYTVTWAVRTFGQTACG